MKKALVVGINQYPSAPLSGCVKDATEFRDLIARNEDGSTNFTALLQTDVLYKHRLKALIHDLFATRSETALFYFSGHGAINERGGYLVTPDHRNFDEGISMSEIVTMANNSPATNKIIILDCCHSGAIAAPNLGPGSIGHINEGITILTASRQEEVAMEVNGKGIFTNLLLEALKGGAADINGNITPGSIYAYIDQALGPWEQRPVFKTNVTTFTTLRHMQPRIAADSLKKINQYFPAPTAVHPLDPSFEDTNIPDREHVCITPYADAAHVAVFRDLQKMHSVGLGVPVDTDHMYWAAMQGKACKLTPLGEHYWRLVQENKI